ncbi:YqcC family protein [Vibrio mexicanus]|uniref:YqcC family protein n=1 Tax=Vibrio mexicanus TaxID=1004326 RepID=UPI00063CD478|nr:YqcC family protein [Vibrio mexicanus]
MTQKSQLLNLLVTLEQTLNDQGLWQVEAPSDEALASQQPFAVDTLQPEQWLQWIFIPKMTYLCRSEAPLPRGFSVTPYFEQVWLEAPKPAVLKVLNQIDEVCR